MRPWESTRRPSPLRPSHVQGKAQDGGVATALLVQALESGMIDCAVVTDRDEEWRTVARVATTADEIRAAAGTKYTISNSVICREGGPGEGLQEDRLCGHALPDSGAEKGAAPG